MYQTVWKFANKNVLAVIIFLCCWTFVVSTHTRAEKYCVKSYIKTFNTTRKILEPNLQKVICDSNIDCQYKNYEEKIINVIEEKLVKEVVCCDGYEETEYRSCSPICTPSCKYGECIAPNVCRCYENFHGTRCEEECEQYEWSPICQRDCNCENNGVCDPYSGQCTCEPGWIGKHCELPCRNGTYGLLCSRKCECENGGICNQADGTCTCLEDWTGTRCETFSKCQCGSGDSCSTDGNCVCQEGWTGNNCDQCIDNMWGEDCNKTCNCIVVTSCDRKTGTCKCPVGFYGTHCTNCPEGTFGLDCKNVCKCQNGAKCNHINGDCKCTAGWMGEFCHETCPENYWGENCNNICNCLNGRCNRTTGDCSCYPGFSGVHCQDKCKEGYFGKSCDNICNCVNGTCDSVTGDCTCDLGYIGLNCSTTICPAGHYGIHCDKCKCDNHVCHPYYGCINIKELAENDPSNNFIIARTSFLLENSSSVTSKVDKFYIFVIVIAVLIYQLYL